jgi:hypothetical protein
MARHPPDARSSCLTISRCHAGKIEEEWELAGTVNLLRQVGDASRHGRSLRFGDRAAESGDWLPG